MITIYKYQFEINDIVTIPMPLGASVLDVQLQGDIPTMWALVNTDNPIEERRFFLKPTGSEIKEFRNPSSYISTFQYPMLNPIQTPGAGPSINFLVFHVFQEFI